MSSAALEERVEGAAAPRRPVWRHGLLAGGTWLAAALVTAALPDTVPWGSRNLFAGLLAGFAAFWAALAFMGRPGSRLVHYGPWLVAIGVWLAAWELITAYTARLWALGFFSGIALGFIGGVALGWSRTFAYWFMPILKLIGPVPASAWIPATFFLFPTTFQASIFLVALASGVPVAILTASGVGSVSRSFYDVARTLGAKQRFLIAKVAIPAALPHVFVGLFMGLYYSFAVLVVAEMLGAKYGMGWYLQFQTAYSAYANVYAMLILMALICSGLVKLLFGVRDRRLGWQKGVVQG